MAKIFIPSLGGDSTTLVKAASHIEVQGYDHYMTDFQSFNDMISTPSLGGSSIVS